MEQKIPKQCPVSKDSARTAAAEDIRKNQITTQILTVSIQISELEPLAQNIIKRLKYLEAQLNSLNEELNLLNQGQLFMDLGKDYK